MYVIRRHIAVTSFSTAPVLQTVSMSLQMQYAISNADDIRKSSAVKAYILICGQWATSSLRDNATRTHLTIHPIVYIHGLSGLHPCYFIRATPWSRPRTLLRISGPQALGNSVSTHSKGAILSCQQGQKPRIKYTLVCGFCNETSGPPVKIKKCYNTLT